MSEGMLTLLSPCSHSARQRMILLLCLIRLMGLGLWETYFYTPPVLGGAAFLPFSAPAVYKNQAP